MNKNETSKRLKEIIEKEDKSDNDELSWYLAPLSYDEVVDYLSTYTKHRERYRDDFSELIFCLKSCISALKYLESQEKN